MGGRGGTISGSILGGGGTRHFYLLTLYNFKNIVGGGGGARAPRAPYSAVPERQFPLWCLLLEASYGATKFRTRTCTIFTGLLFTIFTGLLFPV